MVHRNRIEENLVAFIDAELAPQMLALIQGTELMEGDNIHIDALYRAIKAKSVGKWPIEMAGFKFYEQDLDKLAAYLQR